MKWLLPLILFSNTASAYELSGHVWDLYSPEFHIKMHPGNGDHEYQLAFIEALADWDKQSLLEFTWIDSYANPCTFNDLKSSWGWSVDYCGSGWDDNILAYAHYRYNSDGVIEIDILFNATIDWELTADPQTEMWDFMRVATHEIGHAVLNHSEVREAAMYTYYRSFRWVQADDIAGLCVSYACPELEQPEGYKILNAVYLLLLDNTENLK